MSLFMFDDVLVGLCRNLDLILLLVKHNFCKHVENKQYYYTIYLYTLYFIIIYFNFI